MIHSLHRYVDYLFRYTHDAPKTDTTRNLSSLTTCSALHAGISTAITTATSSHATVMVFRANACRATAMYVYQAWYW